jgi:hypothetical protein
VSACSERKRVSLLLVRFDDQFWRFSEGRSETTDFSMKCRSSHTMCIARLHQHSARETSQLGVLHFWKALFASPNEMVSTATWLQAHKSRATTVWRSQNSLPTFSPIDRPPAPCLHGRCCRPTISHNLVDPASSHMLVSKIKPCMSQYTFLYCKTANGSLQQL